MSARLISFFSTTVVFLVLVVVMMSYLCLRGPGAFIGLRDFPSDFFFAPGFPAMSAICSDFAVVLFGDVFAPVPLVDFPFETSSSTDRVLSSRSDSAVGTAAV